jgi:hypothetical protein
MRIDFDDDEFESGRNDCFIICPLGDIDSDTRKRSDTILKHIFQPVLDANHYKAIRADQVPKVGIITSQIINLIIESELVIADLTDSNPNVFYELAIRHVIKKPYIQVITKGQKIPFDLSAIRTIEFDLTDLDNVEYAKNELKKQILEIRKGHVPDSPVSVASSARILQSDSGLAERIAVKISEWTNYDGWGYSKGDYEKIEEISRKLYGLQEFSLVSLEELSSKLDQIISKMDRQDKK